MSISKKLMTAGGGKDSLSVDDLFSINGWTSATGGTKTIYTNVNLLEEGGMVWVKNRSRTEQSRIVDTVRGAGLRLNSDDNAAEHPGADDIVTGFETNRFTYKHASSAATGDYFCSWTWRKAPGFFDVVTWTGTGSAQSIAHELGVEPAMIWVKHLDAAQGYAVYHKDMASASARTGYFDLSSGSAAGSDVTMWDNTLPDENTFRVGTHLRTNANNVRYVAYLFASEVAEFGEKGDELIAKTGRYVGNGGSPGAEVNIGFRPQYLLVKREGSDEWVCLDSFRGVTITGNSNTYYPSSPALETTNIEYAQFTDKGFKIENNASGFNGLGNTYIYYAIRDNQKSVSKFKTANKLFTVSTGPNTGERENGAFYAPHRVDMALTRRAAVVQDHVFTGRLMKEKYMTVNTTGPMYGGAVGNAGSYDFDREFGWGTWAGTHSDDTSWMWRSAPGFFDMTTYIGDLSSNRQVKHNLGVVPEMLWIRANNGNGMYVYTTYKSGYYGLLNSLDAFNSSGTDWFGMDPNKDYFFTGSGQGNNGSNIRYIACAFASIPGVSKIGTYIGNGVSTIGSDPGGPIVDCGFTPRFIMLKGLDVNSSWIIADSRRGWNLNASGNSVYILKLNSNAAQFDDTAFKVTSTGFHLSNGSGDYNASGKEYLFYAIA